MKRTKARKERGSAIILVVSVLAILVVIVGVSLEYTGAISRQVQRSTTLENAIVVANGCLDHNFAYWRAKCRTTPTLAMNSFALKNLPLPVAAQFPDVSNFSAVASTYSNTSSTTVQQCKTVAADPELNAIDPNGTNASASPIPGLGPTDDGTGNTKTTAIYNYLSTAYVTLPARGTNLVAKVQRVFQKEQVSPWNYAIFFIDPLEIHPGVDFNITGWVHTNSDLFTASNLLHFLDKATFAGAWSVDFKPGDGRRGVTTPGTPTWPTNLPPKADSSHEPFGINPSDTFDTSDANANNDGYHELIDPPVLPIASNPDPIAQDRYYNQAGVIIEISGTNTVTLKRPNGNGTARTINGSSSGADGEIYDMFQGAVSPGAITTIQDNREASGVRIATLNLSTFIDPSNNQYVSDKFNGIVYIQDTTAASNGIGNKRGIRLKNGQQIPSLGLTVASPNPVYIQGDYNTGYNPPSNSGDATKPEGRLIDDKGKDKGAYNRAPCSVLADAVNLLSNAWNDAAAGTSPSASPTTYNTAIVSGIVPTANGNYSGGAENFPRMLESWSGQTLTYYGSMVELYNSKQAIGKWVYGVPIYEAPKRKWFFDTNFRLKSPPGSLMVYTYRLGQWALIP
ncbi:MAG: hypothetical protein ACR2HH_15930 [Chthoniobacterales bacterium]